MPGLELFSPRASLDPASEGPARMSATMITSPAVQRMSALSRASQVRTGRAQLRRDIADGQVTIDQVLCDVPDEAATMQVVELLMCQRRWGRVRARKLLKQVPVAENRRLEQLTGRQRDVIIALLG